MEGFGYGRCDAIADEIEQQNGQDVGERQTDKGDNLFGQLELQLGLAVEKAEEALEAFGGLIQQESQNNAD